MLGMGLLGLSSAGCLRPVPKPDDPRYAPVLPDYQELAKPQGGTLYTPQTALVLFEDQRAKRVGDIITVRFVELTAATKSAKTTTTKQDQVNLGGNPILFGTNASFNVPHFMPLAKKDHLNLGVNFNGQNQFTGGGDVAQKNSLKGDLTVMIAQVLPNGSLMIRGEKWITLNQGSECLRVTGVIRPEDISPDNVILSNRVADARITYTGTGALAESNEIGWLSRFFNSFWMPI